MTSHSTGLMLFVFRRPEHTQRVLEGLHHNDIDHVYVFSDGPRTPADEGPVQRTREIVETVDFCDVDLITHDENKGLKRSIVDGYNHVFNRHQRAIMLENDCVPGPDFVEFMDACLDAYEDEESVMNVHGYCPPIDVPDSYPYDAFFTWRSGSWGQGTWKDAWEHYEEAPSLRNRVRQDQALRERIDRAGRDLVPMLKSEIAGEIDSWAIWWFLALVLNGGLSVNAVHSRVKNIGHDESGRHSGETTHHDTNLVTDSEPRDLDLPPEPKVHPKLNERYVGHFDKRDSSLLDRALSIYRDDGLSSLTRKGLAYAKEFLGSGRR